MEGNGAGGIGVGDLNNDGWLDVYLPSEAQDSLLLNQEGEGWEYRVVDEPSVGESVSMADIDQDGSLDVYVGGRDGNAVLLNDGNGNMDFVRNTGLEPRDEYTVSSAWGDVDGDGDLDLFTATYYFQPPPSGHLQRHCPG